ncbi:MAG: M1 family metallopeptidase, partial [Zetaproteobacteria bacterium]|nr:M1 family metallopeptidase [Flavobacteriales bacterium]
MKLTVFKSLIFSCLFLTAFFSSFAQASLKPLDEIDVLHYHFYINVNDTTDVIEGNASIKFELLKQTDYISFNLDSKDASGLGMEVLKVLYNNKATRYKQNGAILTIKVIENDSNDTQSVSIFYKGIPKDGLIISKNMFGDRTFFGDNWPNRAHYWLPCLDALADKAYVDFYVTAPNHYRVVANGSLVEKDNLLKDRIYTHWKSSVVLPTDVMVVGIARFEVQDLGIIMGVPVSSWVFPQNKEAGFIDYAVADKILAYYIKTIDEYPYKKLANVQSKTRFGGMENASAI